ncbi:12501_t:CDS:2, partial [Funneliformis mosseae]
CALILQSKTLEVEVISDTSTIALFGDTMRAVRRAYILARVEEDQFLSV